MSIGKLVKDLKSKKGFVSEGRLKKGKAWLANHYNVEVSDVLKALEMIRKQRNTALVKYVEEIQDVVPVELPVSKAKSIKVDSSTKKTYWVAGCLHMPFHNRKQFTSTLNFLKSIKLDGIILAGDILDINSLSFHDKGKVPMTGITLEWEYKESLKAFNKIFNLIDYHDISKENLHFMYGNHEDRYIRTLKQIDSSKLGKALIAPEDYLGLEKRGFNLYRDFQRDTIEIGDLIINHGEYLNQHVAKKTVEVYKQSALFFHTHRFQIYADGKFVGYNMGFGGDINSPIFNYAPRGMKSAWTNASALVTVINGKSHVQPLVFSDNKLVVNGIEY